MRVVAKRAMFNWTEYIPRSEIYSQSYPQLKLSSDENQRFAKST
jgi:hypothetical protein